MKKILSLFLAILMSLSVASMIGAAEEVPAIEAEATPELIATKEDVSIYDEAIQYLTEYGILHGKEDGLPHAEDPIKRYEMALFVARISTGWVDDAQWKVWWVGSDATVAEEWYDREHDVTGFTDLEGSGAANFLGALSYASQKKIILGYGDGKFGPEDGIRYEDALTMLCRVLEYNNLEWPWGYIEKAVNLGLTKGIPSTVAYRDRLNRGEVAQLIYNALFAEMKNGGTLASRYFNGALEWKNIIITGAGYGRLLPNDLLKDGKLYDLGDSIAFRIVDEKDGSLDASKTYFVNAKDLTEWVSKRYERYLGFAYKALFTVDENGYVTLYHVKPLNGKTVENRGRLAKVDDAYPIDTFLKGKTLVSKFTLKGNYLNNYNEQYNPSLNEFILRNALQTPPKDEDQSKKIAVQWNNGNNNIVVYESKDGVVTKVVETIWYWNSELKCYFSVLFDKDGNYYGIKILDADEIAKLLKETNKHEYLGGLNIIAPDKPGTTAYADLTPFKLLDDPDYNYGLYEQYGIGKFNTVTDAKDADNKDKPGFSVSGLESIAKYLWDNKLDGTTSRPEDYTNYVVDKTPTEGAGILGWCSELVPENGDYIIYSFDKATKELKVIKIINDKTFDENNYIGYGVLRGYKVADKKFNVDGKDYWFDYNELIGNGLKIHDGDSAYEKNAFAHFFRSLFNQYVKFLVVDGKVVYMEKSNPSNQIIVVDSYAGLSSDGYIVVNGYKSDVLTYQQFKIGSYNGWVKGDYFYYPDNATVDKAFTRGAIYRITSTDKSGTDPVYYVYTVGMNFKTVSETNVTYKLDLDSVNGPKEQNGHYYLHYEDNNGFHKIVDSITETGIHTVVEYDVDDLKHVDYSDFDVKYVSYEFASGYRRDNMASDKSFTKCSGKDKYILVCNPESNAGNGYDTLKAGGYNYAPIVVFTGVPNADWAVEGWRLNGVGDNTFLIVGVDMTKVIGFNVDQYMVNYCLFLGYDYETGMYDSTYAGDWYLLGASTFTAKMFNFYTGTYETRTAVNKDLKVGYTYPCIGDFVVDDDPYWFASLNAVVPGAYLRQWEPQPTANPWHYLFGTGMIAGSAEVDADNKIVEATATGIYKDKDAAKVLFDKEEFSKTVVSVVKDLKDKNGKPIQVKDLVNGTKVYVVTTGANGKISTLTKVDDAAALKSYITTNLVDLVDITNGRTEFNYWWIMDKDGNVVIYLNGTPKLTYTAPAAPVLPTDIASAYIAVKGSSSKENNPHYNMAEEDAGVKAAATAEVVPEYEGADTALIKATIAGYKGTNAKGTKIAGDTLSSISFEWVGDATETNYNEVDKDDFHFGRYDDENLSLYNAYIQIDDGLGTRVYDGKSTCITTGVYTNFDHNDSSKSDLVKKYTFDLNAILKDTWKTLELGISEEGHEENKLVEEWCCPLCEFINDECHGKVLEKNGKIYFNYDLDPDDIKDEVKKINEALLTAAGYTSDLPQSDKSEGKAITPVAGVITVYFTDSNRTQYTFNITLYKIAQVKAVTDKEFGHTVLELDHYIYAADFTDEGGNTIAPMFYEFGDDKPEEAEYYVQTSCNDMFPEFNQADVNEPFDYKFLTTYKGMINPAAKYSYLDWPYYEIH